MERKDGPVRVLVVAVPRSGSSALRVAIDSKAPIFGELLLRNPTDEAAKVFQRNLKAGMDAWHALELLRFSPSTTPGVESSKYFQDHSSERVLGFKLMSTQAIKWFLQFCKLLRGADIVVFLFPRSFIRQVFSLWRIRLGGEPHHYIGRRNSPVRYHSWQEKLKAFLISLLIILLSNILQLACLLVGYLLNFSSVIIGYQSGIEDIQKLVSEILDAEK
jgi:hypothetical protein